MPGEVSPLMDALYHGRRDAAEQLLAERGADSLTIHEAAAMGALPRLTALLEADPQSVNAWAPDGFQPLGLAAFFGQPAAAELLLARGGDLNAPSRNGMGVTALHAALAGPTPEIARALIAAGADVNARQAQDGVTPLQEAAHTGRLDLVRLLLEAGADPSVRDAKGRSAADFAAEQGHSEIATLLAEKG